MFAENVRVSKVTDLNQQCLERLCLFARTTFNAAACSAVPMLSQLSQSPLSTCRSWYSWEAIHGRARRQSCRGSNTPGLRSGPVLHARRCATNWPTTSSRHCAKSSMIIFARHYASSRSYLSEAHGASKLPLVLVIVELFLLVCRLHDCVLLGLVFGRPQPSQLLHPLVLRESGEGGDQSQFASPGCSRTGKQQPEARLPRATGDSCSRHLHCTNHLERDIAHTGRRRVACRFDDQRALLQHRAVLDVVRHADEPAARLASEQLQRCSRKGVAFSAAVIVMDRGAAACRQPAAFGS